MPPIPPVPAPLKASSALPRTPANTASPLLPSPSSTSKTSMRSPTSGKTSSPSTTPSTPRNSSRSSALPLPSRPSFAPPRGRFPLQLPRRILKLPRRIPPPKLESRRGYRNPDPGTQLPVGRRLTSHGQPVQQLCPAAALPGPGRAPVPPCHRGIRAPQVPAGRITKRSQFRRNRDKRNHLRPLRNDPNSSRRPRTPAGPRPLAPNLRPPASGLRLADSPGSPVRLVILAFPCSEFVLRLLPRAICTLGAREPSSLTGSTPATTVVS